MGENVQRSDLNRVTQDALLCDLKAGYRHLDLAENYNHLDGVEAALAWSMAKGCFVIPKSTRPDRIEENYGALDFVDAVKGEPELTAAIDSSEDLGESGVTLTTEEMRHHGEALRWDVSESLSLGRI